MSDDDQPPSGVDSPAMLHLKAKAYDCLAQVQRWQQELNRVNAQIAVLAGQQPSTNTQHDTALTLD